MKPVSFILRFILLFSAVSGAAAVLVRLFLPPDLFAPRREYDLELRFVLSLPRKLAEEKKNTPSLPPQSVIPEQFRALITAKAQKYALPPELIAAVIARESGFDPHAAAPDGGKGLMQLMPAVCADFKCSDPFDPGSNVETGCAHLAKLRSFFSQVPDPGEQLHFALAAYNAGPGHIFDARRLAKKLKLDPDKWQGNVEEAVQFLKFRSFWKSARHGYCNADIVVNYVNSVLALAERFKNH